MGARTIATRSTHEDRLNTVVALAPRERTTLKFR
jgi:hypothetical protein